MPAAGTPRTSRRSASTTHAVRRSRAASAIDLTLRDAQLALARKYGFQGWNALVQNVGRGQVAGA